MVAVLSRHFAGSCTEWPGARDLGSVSTLASITLVKRRSRSKRWTPRQRTGSLIGVGLHGIYPPAAPKRCFLRVADQRGVGPRRSTLGRLSWVMREGGRRHDLHSTTAVSPGTRSRWQRKTQAYTARWDRSTDTRRTGRCRTGILHAGLRNPPDA
jgi:hypothetical protein